MKEESTMKEIKPLYLVYVDTLCEPKGLSHIKVPGPYVKGRPELLCGSSDPVNWTVNPKPPTQVCPRCQEIYDSQNA